MVGVDAVEIVIVAEDRMSSSARMTIHEKQVRISDPREGKG
jgi:hypothetical protein